jgi:hypothetical protein
MVQDRTVCDWSIFAVFAFEVYLRKENFLKMCTNSIRENDLQNPNPTIDKRRHKKIRHACIMMGIKFPRA